MHPFAGQGVNLGFGDVIQLTRTIQTALKSGTDIGNLTLLQSMYETLQFQRNEVMLAILESLHKIFGIDNTYGTRTETVVMTAGSRVVGHGVRVHI